MNVDKSGIKLYAFVVIAISLAFIALSLAQ